MFILFKFHYLPKDGILELGTLEFPMLPRNQRARTVLSTAESQTSGQKNGIPEFRVNAPLGICMDNTTVYGADPRASPT